MSGKLPGVLGEEVCPPSHKAGTLTSSPHLHTSGPGWATAGTHSFSAIDKLIMMKTNPETGSSFKHLEILQGCRKSQTCEFCPAQVNLYLVH